MRAALRRAGHDGETATAGGLGRARGRKGTMKELQMRARRWLVRHDPEWRDGWLSLPIGADFAGAVRDNINSFGPHRSGDKIVAEYEARINQRAALAVLAGGRK
jgi:hypothetical protein